MSHQKPIDDMEKGWSGFDRPSVGQVFRHYKGGRYEIVETGFIEETLSPCVIYRALRDNTVWVRSAANFFESVEFEGTTMPRFSPDKT